jgi:hypothetical protein
MTIWKDAEENVDVCNVNRLETSLSITCYCGESLYMDEPDDEETCPGCGRVFRFIMKLHVKTGEA